MITIREYLDSNGHSPFAKWFSGLNAPAAAKVATSLVRIEHGIFRTRRESVPASLNAELISGPVIESISGKMAMRSLSWLGAEAKKHQDTDIRTAHERWEDYKERKTREK